MVSPGNNAGKIAAATAKIKACMETMRVEALAFPVGSKQFNAVMGALRTLNPILGKPTDQDLVPAARRQIAEAPKPPLAGMPPPGMGGGAPPAPPPMGGAPNGIAGGGEAQAEM